jgi:hypothetical protein
MGKLKYCITCYLEKDEEKEFAKGSYFCRKCKERHGGQLFLEPETPLSEIFKRLDAEMARRTPAPKAQSLDNRLSKDQRKKLKKDYKNGRK